MTEAVLIVYAIGYVISYRYVVGALLIRPAEFDQLVETMLLGLLVTLAWPVMALTVVAHRTYVRRGVDPTRLFPAWKPAESPEDRRRREAQEARDATARDRAAQARIVELERELGLTDGD